MKNLLTILLFLLPVIGYSQNSEEAYEFSIDLNENWVVFDEGYDSFVPFRAGQHSNAKAHSLVIDAESNINYDLLIKVDKPDQYLFINGSLSQTLKENNLLAIPIKSLVKNKNRWVYISIFGDSNVKTKKVYLGFRKEATKSIVALAKKEVLTMKRRVTNEYANMTIIGSFVLLIFVAFASSSYPRAYPKFIDITNVFNSKVREVSALINKPFSRINMTFLMLLSVLTGLITWCFLDLKVKMFEDAFYLLSVNKFGAQLVNFIILSVLAYSLYFSKLIYIKIVGSIFGIGKIVDLHFFKILQVSLSMFMPAVIILLIYSFSGYRGDINPDYLLYYGVLVFYLLRTVAIFFALNTNAQIQIHYLITYLCVVELLPLVLGLRFVV